MSRRYAPPQQDKKNEASQKLIESQNITIADLKRRNAALEVDKQYLNESINGLRTLLADMNIRLGETVTRMQAAEREVGNRGIMINVLTEKIRSLEGYIVSLRAENFDLQSTLQSSQTTSPGDVEVQAEEIHPQPPLATVEAQVLEGVEIVQTDTQILSRVLQDACENVSQASTGPDQEEQEGSASNEDEHIQDQTEDENGPENEHDKPRDEEDEVFNSYSRGLQYSTPVDTMPAPVDQPTESFQQQQEVEQTAPVSASIISPEERQRLRKLRKEHQKEQRKLERELRQVMAEIRARDEAEDKERARMEKAQRAAEKKAQAQAEAEAEAKRKAEQEAEMKRKAEEAEKRRIRLLEKDARRKAEQAKERARINAIHERELAKYRANQAAAEAEKKAGKQQDEGKSLPKSAQAGTQKEVETKHQLEKEEVIKNTVKALTTRTEQETALPSASGPKVAVITLPVPKNRETTASFEKSVTCGSIENWKNMILLRNLCKRVCDTPMPNIQLTKPDSEFQHRFMYLLMLEIHTKTGPHVFTIHNVQGGGYSLRCEIQETKDDQMTFGPVNLETISFWFETDGLEQACFRCYPRLLEEFSGMRTVKFDCVREDIQKYFQIMLSEARALCDTLKLQESSDETDGWGLPKYSILVKSADSKGIYKCMILPQITLLVWYLKGKLAYLAGM